MSSEKQAQDRDPSREEAELIGRIIQSEQRLSDYFTTIITRSVTEQLDARNMFRLRVIGMVTVVLISVAIPGIMSWTRGTISKQTENALHEQFSAASADLQSQFNEYLDQERRYSSFTNYLLYLSDRGTAPQGSLNEVRLRLVDLASNPSTLQRSEFPYLLDILVRLAISHNDRALLDFLEIDFASLMTSPRTMPRLARYHGERILGDRFISESRRQDAILQFQKYVDASELAAEYETLLPLQLMVESRRNTGAADEIGAGIKTHVQEMGPQDQASFIAETVRYSNPRFWEAPTTNRSRRIALAAGQLVIEQRAFYIQLLDSVAVQTALIDIAESEANRGNTMFSTALSGFRNAFSGELASTDGELFRKQISRLVDNDIRLWVQDELIIRALREQNLQTSNLSSPQISELETQWRQEFESGAYDLIESVQERAISRLLRRLKRDSFGMYREIYVMDGVGLLVGASDPNNDYWQGEEPKWLETYRRGAGSMHIGELKFDESALAWQVQISLPVLEPGTREPIGAITIGVDPSMLEGSF